MGELVVVSGFVDSEGFFVGIAEEVVDFSRKVVDFRKLFVGNAWKVVGIYSVVDSERVFVDNT